MTEVLPGVEIDRAVGRSSSRPGRSLVAWLVRTATVRPVLTVTGVALVLRVGLAVVSFLVHHQQFIPDEYQYLRMAHLVASGRSADAMFPGYGQDLYDSVRPFMAPLSLLFRILPDSRLVGQLYVVAFGALTAALTTVVARRVVRPPWALAAGLVVAVLPSQVVLSSVVLREAMIWSILVGLALLLLATAETTGWRTMAGLLAIAALLLALLYLRTQTAVVVAWALILGTWIEAGRRRLARSISVTVLALVLPVVAGLGLGGAGLVANAAPALARTRTYLGFNADSALTTPQQAEASCDNDPTTRPKGEVGASALADTKNRRLAGDGGAPSYLVCDLAGTAVVVEDGVGQNLRYLPRGLLATLARPFPWERIHSAQTRSASLENVVWVVLYALAAVGVVAGGWGRLRRLAFPFLVGVLLIGSAAVSQGNLGTAFRHRQQVLWAVALFAALGASDLVARRARRAGRAVVDS